MNKITIESVDIPIPEDNLDIKGSIYFSSNTPRKAPFIIICSALREIRDSRFIKYYSESFSNAGYYVLTYDHRAHGETAKQTGSNWFKYIPQIYSDLQKVISWIFSSQKERLLDEKIVLFGRSVGGAIILTCGYNDVRVRLLIALAARYDYSTVQNITFPPEIVKIMSPKYYIHNIPLNNERILIAHCRDDKVIPFSNFVQIKNHLGLNDRNSLVFEEGGHSFKGHRDEILSHVLNFIKRL